MAITQVGIANLALNRIGARPSITSLTENSPDAKKVAIVWDYIFQEVLSERDWKFAKIYAELELSLQRPLYGYRHAWAVPSDFLRLVRPYKRPPDHNYEYYWGYEGWGWYHRQDPPFWPMGYPYKVQTLLGVCNFTASIATTVLTVSAVANGVISVGEPICGTGVTSGTFITSLGSGTGGTGTYNLNNSQTIASEAMTCPDPTTNGNKYVLTDYNGCRGTAKINYIRLISDYTQLMPGFINCLTNRLAAELAIGITEDKQKFEGMMQMYRDSLNSAEAQNETMDFSKDESGSETWERAGRFIRYY